MLTPPPVYPWYNMANGSIGPLNLGGSPFPVLPFAVMDTGESVAGTFQAQVIVGGNQTNTATGLGPDGQVNMSTSSNKALLVAQSLIGVNSPVSPVTGTNTNRTVPSSTEST